MKRLLPLFLLLFSTAAFAQDTTKILFLGNSYTYVNDLPFIVQSLAAAGGETVYRDSYAPGGYTFMGHSTDLNALGKIAQQPWDFVVLQEQSQRPSFPQSQVSQEVYPYATILNDSIQANDSCTVTVFYMTWGRKHGDASNCGFWPPVCTYAGMQYELRRSYLNMATQNEALVAPCGIAWWESIKRDSTLELYQPDESHPAYTGSYLNGCVFYATMFRRSPLGLSYRGSLDSTTATFLQQVAHDIVFDSLTQWRMWLDDVDAAFTYNMDTQGNVSFSNTSLNGLQYSWDFGDGNTSTTPVPQHQYATDGSYVVTLIATDGCTSDTVSETVNVVIVGRTEAQARALTLVPNPAQGRALLRGHADAAMDVRVTDLAGRVVWRSRVAGPGAFELLLELDGLARGTYLVHVDGHGAQRLVLE